MGFEALKIKRPHTKYEKSRVWSDRFIPEIRQIVGPHLLEVAPLEVDTQEATDLIVFKARDLRVAARVRKHGLQGDFLWQFTMRSKVRSGSKTELEKIIDGWGDLMLYAHAAKDENSIERWFLIDLAAWRAQRIMDSLHDDRRIVRGDKENGDGTATPHIMRASSHDLPLESEDQSNK